MKKIATYGFSAILALAIVAVSASLNTANAQNAGLISSILNRMEKNRQNLKSLRASISLDTFDNGLGRWDGARTGTVMVIPAAVGRSANVRIDWTSAPQESFSYIGGKYTLFRPRLNLVYEGNKAPGSTGTLGGVFALLNMSGSQARSSYDVNYLNEDGGASHLKITPKRGGDFKFAEIWVDGSGMVVQAKITSRNDDAQMVHLTNVQKNAAISLDQLKVNYPSSVKIVKT